MHAGSYLFYSVRDVINREGISEVDHSTSYEHRCHANSIEKEKATSSWIQFKHAPNKESNLDWKYEDLVDIITF